MGKWIHRLSNKDFEAKVADCAECGLSVRIKINYRGYAVCFKANKVVEWKRIFGLTDAQCAFISDHFYCEVCGSTDNLCLDHDHSCHPRGQGCTECVRGILCRQCNFAEGQLLSDPNLALKLYEYMIRHRAENY